MAARTSSPGAGFGPWRTLVAVTALAAALTLMPPALAERTYARALYPSIQRVLTGLSNPVPIALFDVVAVLAVLLLVLLWRRGLSRAARRRHGTVRATASTMVRTLLVAAAGVLWFQVAWGLNYGRPPVDVRLELPAAPPSPEEVTALLARAVAGANADHAAAHAAGFPGPGQVPAALVEALHEVERQDGRPVPTTPGRPKATLLGWYFRAAGVDGMTAPALLETLLNPDLTGPERAFVVAHEWAHLAGYAPEADANFVAWRACARADPAARYSAWLFLVGEAARQVPGETRRRLLGTLDAGPRADLDDIARRASTAVDLVQRVGWRVYDGYLKAQGIAEGVGSYSRVVELIIRAERRSSPASSRR
ncbi:MAG: DUF3810 family protein [Vicinamibacterales bacterium]